MSITVSRNVTGGGLTVSQDTTVTGDNTNKFEVTVGTSVTDDLLNISLDVDKIKGYYIHANNTLQIETNAVDATGGNTLNLVANEPLVFMGDTDLYTNLLTLDVTKMYLTNASGSNTVTLKMVFEQDATP